MNQTAPPIDPRYAPEYVWCPQLIIGSVQLFIAASGVNAWFPCSVPDYSPGPPGTVNEYRIAHNAVKLLAKQHSGNNNIQPSQIRAALEACGWEADELQRYPKDS